MPLENGETILGVIQTNFVARDTINGRDAINTLAYIKLLEAAQEQYARDGVQIDIRDIVWTSITYDGEIFEIRESPPRHGNTLIFRGQGSPCGLLQPDDP